jgi:hypothetical protein
MATKVVERHSDVYLDNEYLLPGKFHRGKSRTTSVLTSQLYPAFGGYDSRVLTASVTSIELADIRTYPVTSQLYGHVATEQASVTASTLSINLRYAATPLEKVSQSFATTAMVLKDIVITHNQPNDDKISGSFSTLTMVLTTVVRNHTQPNDDKMGQSFSTLTMDLKTVVVTQTQPNEDKISGSFATLAMVLAPA